MSLTEALETRSLNLYMAPFSYNFKMPLVTGPIDVSTHHLGQFKALNTCTQDLREHWGQALSMRCVSQMCPTVQRWGRSHVFGSSVVRNFLWFFSSPPSPARSVIIFRLKRLVNCLPGCQRHVCPNDHIRRSPPPPTPSFLSPVLISTSFARPSATHSINFAATSLFKGKTQSGMDFSGWWGDSGGSGELLTEVSVAL